MFERSQDLYDAIYAGKDYAGEAARLTAIVRERIPEASTLLDVACGTGRHIEHLQAAAFACEGLDVDERLLAHARRRNPGVPFHAGDMVAFDLGRTFDVVTCLFSSVAACRSLKEMRAAVAAMARHVASPGLLVLEPWLSPDRFDPGYVGLDVAEEQGRKIVRMGGSRREGDRWVFTPHYLVGQPERIEYFHEEISLGMWSHEEYSDAVRDVGLSLEHDPAGLIGRGLYIGTRA